MFLIHVKFPPCIHNQAESLLNYNNSNYPRIVEIKSQKIPGTIIKGNNRYILKRILNFYWLLPNQTYLLQHYLLTLFVVTIQVEVLCLFVPEWPSLIVEHFYRLEVVGYFPYLNQNPSLTFVKLSKLKKLFSKSTKKSMLNYLLFNEELSIDI